MRSVAKLALGVCLAAASACHDPLPRETLRAELLGCYRLTYADSANASRWSAPRYVVLDSAHAGPRPGRYLQLVHSEELLRRGGWWLADSLSEMVRLTITDGFVAVQLALAGDPDSLRGRATVSTDVAGGRKALGRVVAHRLSCAMLPARDNTIAAPAT